MLWHTWIEAPA
jgi:hypothetical protein